MPVVPQRRSGLWRTRVWINALVLISSPLLTPRAHQSHPAGVLRGPKNNDQRPSEGPSAHSCRLQTDGEQQVSLPFDPPFSSDTTLVLFPHLRSREGIFTLSSYPKGGITCLFPHNVVQGTLGRHCLRLWPYISPVFSLVGRF